MRFSKTFTGVMALTALFATSLLMQTEDSAAAGKKRGLLLSVQGSGTNTPLGFYGLSRVIVRNRAGKVNVKRTDGVACNGDIKLGFSYTSGTGRISCRDGVTANFNFSIYAYKPLRGRGVGQTSDARKFNINIVRQYE